MTKKELKEKVKEFLERGVEEVLPSKKGLERLLLQKKIRAYLGVDPTAPHLHLGHTIPLRKLNQLAEMGHEVILLFGTFTARIGDPSGRDEARKPLSKEEVKRNMRTYKRQAGKILNLKKVKILQNHTWLEKMDLSKFLSLASHFTVARLLERDMFQRRMKEGREIYVHEFLYPLLQGYDSVAMNVDLEIGGSDQLFNMLVGRRMQLLFNNKEKYVLTFKMIEGTDGRKMSKSLGNTINILDPPEEMFGKVMSIKDHLILPYFELLTSYPWKELKKIERALKQGTLSPRDAKEILAFEIVKEIWGERKAKRAREEFHRVFKERKLPSQIPEMKITDKKLSLVDLLVKTKLAPSRSEAKRLIVQGGVKLEGARITDWKAVVEIKKGMVLQVGKRKFVKIV